MKYYFIDAIRCGYSEGNNKECQVYSNAKASSSSRNSSSLCSDRYFTNMICHPSNDNVLETFFCAASFRYTTLLRGAIRIFNVSYSQIVYALTS